MAPWHDPAPALALLALSASLVSAETGGLCLNGLDDDLDGLIDCADPGCGADASVGPLDLRVSRFGPDRVLLLSWSGADPGTSIDVAGGELPILSAPLRGCIFDSVLDEPRLSGPILSDPRPGPGSSWFLVRGESPCAQGSFGTHSLGDERVIDPACRPGDVVAACEGAPTPDAVSAWTDCDVTTPFDLVVHLTNDTMQPLAWWSASCPSTPDVDRLLGPSNWVRLSPCVVCADGSAEWLDLAPGETVSVDAGTWRPSVIPGTYRAWFIVAEDCTVGGERALESCPDARVVTTLPFVID